jgi:hypothetical protein
MATTGASWVAAQLLRCSVTMDRPQMPVNPRPPGVLRPGSASEAVLALLRSHPGRMYRRWQLIGSTGRSRKSVDYALLFLERTGAIDVIRDGAALRFRARQTRS